MIQSYRAAVMMTDSKLLCYSHYLQAQLKEVQKLCEKCSDFLYILMKILCSEQYKAWEEYRDIISHYSVSVSTGMRDGVGGDGRRHPMDGLSRSGVTKSGMTVPQVTIEDQAMPAPINGKSSDANGDKFAQDEVIALMKIPTANIRVIAMHGYVYYMTCREYKRSLSSADADPDTPQWALVRAILTYDSNLYLYKLTEVEEEEMWQQAASFQDSPGKQGRRQLGALPESSSRWCGNKPLLVIPTEYAAVNILNQAGRTLSHQSNLPILSI